MKRADILVVDDEPDIRRLVQEILEDENYLVRTAENAAAARRFYSEHHPDLVLLDIWMPDTDGISLLKEWASAGTLTTPVVIMSGHGNVDTAVEATRLGAFDFIEKPVSMNKLLVTIDRALQTEKLRQENQRLRAQIEPVSALSGKSPAMRKLREDIERIAATEAWVLISGEQGCGKGVAARSLHEQSKHSTGALIEITLGSVPSQNIPLQLYGSEIDGRVIHGGLEQASGGTLVLHEIADLDVEAQTDLVRTLEDGRFLRLGGHEPIEIGARIVATVSTEPEQALASGRLREDLFFRLNLVPLHIPPLREHREDVPELVSFYVDWFAENEHLPYRKFTTGALNSLRNYAWPGNVQELKNVVQRLLILGRGVEVEGAEVEQQLGSQAGPLAGYQQIAHEGLYALPLRDARDQFERGYLEYHLRQTGGNVSQVAEFAGMERTHLYRKLKQLGVSPKQQKQKKT